MAEGRFVAGCLTCPWHGYQYRMEDGCSPPPFTEKIPTFKVRVEVEGSSKPALLANINFAYFP